MLDKITALILSFIILTNVFWPAASLANENHALSYLSINSNMSGATIYLNGSIIGTTPLEQPMALKPGFYSIKTRKEGYSTTWREDIVLSPGEKAEITAIMVSLDPIDPETLKPKKKPFHDSWLFWTIVLIGIGIAVDSSGRGGDKGALQVNW